MISLSTDIADLILQRTLNDNTIGLNSAVERMTTGYKINHAKDNAANFSIATDLSKKISSMLQIQNNTDDGIAMLQTAEGGLEEIQGLLERLRDLSMRAANGTYDEQSRNAMQEEADAITEEIARIRNTMKYNGLSLYETPRESETLTTRLAKSAKINERSAAPSNGVANISLNAQGAEGLASRASFSNNAGIMAMADDTIDGAIDFKGRESKTIDIDGIKYTVTNNQTSATTFTYSKNKTTGEVTFYSNNYTIKGQLDVAHNIIVAGKGITIYGGDLADTIKAIDGVVSAVIYGGKGDDILTGSKDATYIYGEDGNDIITSNANGGFIISGGNGDDIITVNGSGNEVFAGDGNDTINVNVNACSIYGEDGDDTFNVSDKSGSSFIDGGAGLNKVLGTPHANTTMINVDRANALGFSFNAKETKDVVINGIGYKITNTKNSSNTLIYSIANDGAIIFSKGSSFTIEGDKNKAHNVVLNGSNTTFYGGNLADKIVCNNVSATVYAYDGDDIVDVNSGNNCKIYLGNGDDTLNLNNGYTHTIYGEAGNNTFNINVKNGTSNYTNFIIGGSGNDTFNVSDTANTYALIAGEGNNILNGDTKEHIVAGFADHPKNSEFITIGANETRNITINGIEYSIKNKLAIDNKVAYSYNSVTGEITFAGVSVDITGAKDKEHNIILNGKDVYLHTGNLADKVVSYGATNRIYTYDGDDDITMYDNATYTYAGAGNDTITGCAANHAYGEDGDDILIAKGGASLYGGDGNDTYYIYEGNAQQDTGGDNIYYIYTNNKNISGGEGNDTFYINGSGNTIKGNAGNDYFVIDGNNNNIEGGTGTNYVVDNGSGNALMNAEVDPNSGALSFTYKGEVKTFTLNGKTYTVTNNLDGINTLNYSLNQNTGVITTNGSDFQIDAASNEQAILNVRGDNNTVNGSNLADRITIEQGSGNVVNGLDGNDTLIMNSENNSVLGGEGNDTITLNASTNLDVDGGAGNDTLNINSDNNTQVIAGAGDDKITVSGKNNNITAGDGNNNITINNSNNTVNAANGDNKFVVNGSENTVTAGNGNNSIGVQGNNNNVTAQNAKGDINIIGNDNTISNTRGENKVIIKGSGNNYSSTVGKKDVTITGSGNEVLTGAGNDTFTVKGDSNSVESTSGKNEFNIRGNSNTVQGGTDIDDIKLNGNNNSANGGDASDTFMVSGGNGNTIDGEAGDRNTLIDNGRNTTYTNAVDITPRPFEARIKVDIGSGDDTYITTSISFNLFDFSVDFSTNESARDSLEKIDDMIKNVQEQILNIGTSINRLQTISEAQALKLQNLISTRSTIQDADIANESSNFIRYQILQQASTTLMSSSRNIKAESVLGLLQGIR